MPDQIQQALDKWTELSKKVEELQNNRDLHNIVESKVNKAFSKLLEKK